MSTEPMWTDVVQAIAAASVPVLLGIAGIVVTRRQNRSTELLKARLDYYRTITPKLNLLMSYITYIGRWRDQTPPEIIELKRKTDEEFFVAAPLYSKDVSTAYTAVMSLSFKTFGEWGQDAKIVQVVSAVENRGEATGTLSGITTSPCLTTARPPDPLSGCIEKNMTLFYRRW